MTTVFGAIVAPEFFPHLRGNALTDEAARSGKKEEAVVYPCGPYGDGQVSCERNRYWSKRSVRGILVAEADGFNWLLAKHFEQEQKR